MERSKKNVSILSGIAVIMLITTQLLSAQFYGYILNLLNVVTVPLIFFVIGYSLNINLTIKKIVIDNVKKLLIPYILISLVIVLINKGLQIVNKPGIFSTPFPSMLTGLKTLAYGIIWPTNTILGFSDFGVGVLWLLLGTFFAVCIFLFVYKIPKTWLQITAVILITLGGYSLNRFVQLPWSFEAACVVQPYLYFGYQFKNSDHWEISFSTFFVGIILWFALSRTGSFDYGVANIPHWLLGTITSLFAIICLYYVVDKGYRWKLHALSRLVSYLGTHFEIGVITITLINSFLQLRNYLSKLISSEIVILILNILITCVILLCVFKINDYFMGKMHPNKEVEEMQI
ncbi:hypothetical protein ACEF14_03390 [Weissella paramesenteroides]